jgi:hypothetical protein
MQKIWRIGFIGALHATVYLWLLPYVILPKFGNKGTKITVAVLIVISFIVLSRLFLKKRRNNNPGRKIDSENSNPEKRQKFHR